MARHKHQPTGYQLDAALTDEVVQARIAALESEAAVLSALVG